VEEQVGQLIPLRLIDELGVSDSLDGSVVDEDGGGAHGACEGAEPNFVYADDVRHQ
jgi:hypothetical protein